MLVFLCVFHVAPEKVSGNWIVMAKILLRKSLFRVNGYSFSCWVNENVETILGPIKNVNYNLIHATQNFANHVDQGSRIISQYKYRKVYKSHKFVP